MNDQGKVVVLYVSKDIYLLLADIDPLLVAQPLSSVLPWIRHRPKHRCSRLLLPVDSWSHACGSCAAVACLEAAALHCLSLGLHLPKFSYFLFAFIYLSDCGCMRKMRNSVDWNFSVSTFFFFFFVPVMNFIICFPSFEEKLAYWNHVLFTFKFSGNVTFWKWWVRQFMMIQSVSIKHFVSSINL